VYKKFPWKPQKYYQDDYQQNSYKEGKIKDKKQEIESKEYIAD